MLVGIGMGLWAPMIGEIDITNRSAIAIELSGLVVGSPAARPPAELCNRPPFRLRVRMRVAITVAWQRPVG